MKIRILALAAAVLLLAGCGTVTDKEGTVDNIVIPTTTVTTTTSTDEATATTTADDNNAATTTVTTETAASTTKTTADTTKATTATPTTKPTTKPTAAPTTKPTAAPTTKPTAAPTTAPTTVPTTAPVNEFYNPNNNFYDINCVSIRPGYVYWKDGCLYAECFITNGLSKMVYNLDVQSLQFKDGNGKVIAASPFGTLNNVAVAPYSYVVHTFIFGSADVAAYGADLSYLDCTSNVSYYY